MKKLLLLSFVAFIFCNNDAAFCQTPINADMHAAKPAAANLTSFTQPGKVISDEIIAANAGFELDPELGVVYKNAPAGNYYELLGKRTETSKTYAKAGTSGTQIVIRSGNYPLHYRDEQGKWRTVISTLAQSATPGIFSTSGQPLNIAVNTVAMNSSITNTSGSIAYNNGLELIYLKTDGTEQSLGTAN